MIEPGLGRDVARDRSVSVTASHLQRPRGERLAGESEKPPAELRQMGRVGDEHGLAGAAQGSARGARMRIGHPFAGGTLAAARRQVSPQDLHDLRGNGSGYRWAAPPEHAKRRRIDLLTAVRRCVRVGRLFDAHAAKLRGWPAWAVGARASAAIPATARQPRCRSTFAYRSTRIESPRKCGSTAFRTPGTDTYLYVGPTCRATPFSPCGSWLQMRGRADLGRLGQAY